MQNLTPRTNNFPSILGREVRRLTRAPSSDVSRTSDKYIAGTPTARRRALGPTIFPSPVLRSSGWSMWLRCRREHESFRGASYASLSVVLLLTITDLVVTHRDKPAVYIGLYGL